MEKAYVVSGISKVRRAANMYIEQQLDEYGLKELKTSYGSIMSVLYRNKGSLPMGKIAELIRRDKSTVTCSIEKLEALGYVTKQKDAIDKRVTNIVLTPKAHEQVQAFSTISKHLRSCAFNGFSECEQDQFVELLERMYQNFIDAHQEEAERSKRK